MSIQLITATEEKLFTVEFATVVHSDDKSITVLLRRDTVDEELQYLLGEQEGWILFFSPDSEGIKTIDHLISDSTSIKALSDDQWIITFNLSGSHKRLTQASKEI